MLQIDANKNGSLEAREVERLLMTIADDASQIITHKTVRSAMDRLDTNKDKRITFDEFIRVSLELLDTAAWSAQQPIAVGAHCRLQHSTCQSVWQTGNLPLQYRNAAGSHARCVGHSGLTAAACR